MSLAARRIRRASRSLLGLALLAVALPAPAWGQATISSPGPLTEIIMGPQLNCQVRYGAEEDFSFFSPSNRIGTCGTYIARGQTVISPGGYATPTQTGPTGSGTATDPFTIATQVCAGTAAQCSAATAPVVTTFARYVTGQDYFSIEIRVTSRATAAETIGIYQYADCYLQESDQGYGFYDASTGGVYCSRNPNNSPPARIEGFVPVEPGSSWDQGHFSAVRGRVTGSTGQPLRNACDCETLQDNGMALGWTGISLAPGETVTRSLLVAFSPTGVPSDPTPDPPPPPPPPPPT